MKSHVLLLTLLSIVLPAHFLFSNSTPPFFAIEFQRLFGNGLDNRFNKVIRVGDDYYVLGTDEPNEGATPHATLSRLNFQGQTQWTIRLSVPSVWNDIALTDEGNLLLVGGTSPYDGNANSLIGLASPSGNFLWVRYYNLADREVLTKVIRHPNPVNPAFPYYILGATQQLVGSSNDDINLLNIDAAGNFNWRKLLGSTADEEFYRDLEVLSNGNLLMVGHAGSTAVTVQVNNAGTVISGNSYGVGMRINDAVERPGGGYILAGSSTPANPAQISRLNASFQSVWSRTLPQLAFLNRVWIGPDQAIYAMGFGSIDGVNRNVVIKIVENNNTPSIQWVKYLDGGETAFANGNIFFLAPDQIAYVDGRTANPSGFGQSDAFLSISSLDLETCVTKTGPSLSMSSFSLSSNAYVVTDAAASIPLGQDMPFAGLAWQQVAICGSSCEPVNSNTFSTVLAPQGPESEIELALDGFEASNGEHVALGFSTAFSPFTLDLIFTRMDEKGQLIADPQYLEFSYNGNELEALIDSETPTNAHLTEVFDGNGNSQGYLMAVTMFNTALPPGNSTLDVLAALLDHSGCVVWSRYMERAGSDEYARDVIQLAGGELVVLVNRFQPATGVNTMELLSFSINGQNCSDLQFNLPSTDEFFPSAIANVEGLTNPSATVAVGGYWKSGQRFLGIYLLQSDLTLATPGPLLYDMLPANPEETPFPTGILQNGENLVVAGYMTKNSPDREAFLMEVRPYTPSGIVDGLPLWARRIRNNATNAVYGNGFRIYGLDKNPAGELFVAGAAMGANDEFFRAFLIKTNQQGVAQWTNLFPGAFGNESAQDALAYHVDVANDGSLVLAGYRPRPDSSDGFFWVSRTDPGGNLNNCDCFDPLSLLIENYQPEFSQTTSPEPTSVACAGGITIPSCVAYTPSQLFCDQFFPQPLCEAAFDWAPLNSCGGIGFTNQSNGALPTYLWQFGDQLNSTSTQANPTFTYFSSGSYNVCLTITTADCDDTHCEVVTVNIAGAPATLTCPPNITVQADPGVCENTSYQLSNATVVDNCPCDLILDVTYPAGYQGPYQGGANTFTVTAIDGCGVVNCLVTVTVDDGGAPVITCPDDVLLQFGSPTDPAATGEATAIDPCGSVTITFADVVIFSGECESVIERTWTAVDAAGNEDTCVQLIESFDLTPIAVVCPADIEVEADPVDCSAVLQNIDLELLDDCISQGTLEISYTLSGASSGSGSGFPIGNVPFLPGVTEVEMTVVENPESFASCSFSVTVNESVPPQIQCPASICVVAAPGTQGAVVQFAQPNASDNCSGVSVVSVPASGSVFPVGTTIVSSTATDAAGNTASCNFTVEVAPENFSGQFSANILPGCGGSYQFTPLFLDPSFEYAWDFGDGASSSLPSPEHTFGENGNYTVGLVLSSTFGCESAGQVELEILTQFQAVFSYATACLNVSFLGVPDDPGYTWTWDLPGGPQQGSTVMATFPDYGIHEVCVTVTDGLCEITLCQNIELAEDNESPELSCPAIQIQTDPGACSATYTPAFPAATDNCSDPSELQYSGVRFDGLPLSAPWPLGNNCMTWTVTDQAGETAICVQCIAVEDQEAPAIDCPDDVTVQAAAGASSAVVQFDNTTAADNCGTAQLSCSAGSGDVFPLGTTEVTCNAADDEGNASSCTFNVIVLPSIDTCCVDSLAFVANVDAGYTWEIGSGCEHTFVPSQLNACQVVLEWQWGDGTVATGPFLGTAEVAHIFLEGGDYEICMVVAEVDETSGDICWERTYCETLAIDCGDPCEYSELGIATGYDYANNELYPATTGVVDNYWVESNSLQMIVVDQVDSLAPLPGSNWIVPMTLNGYRNHEIEFKFCLPEGAFNCQDLVFDLGIQAWALATIRINGRPVSGPLFLSPAYGVAGNWLYQPSAADCSFFKQGDNRLTVELKTVIGAAGMNISGSIITSSGSTLLGSPDCCPTAPECSCDEFSFDAFGIERSELFEGNPCLRAFRPVGVDACDEVEWYLNTNLVGSSTGADWVNLELPNGAVEVCMRVSRTDLNGNFCGVVEKCQAFIIECGYLGACDGGVIDNPGMEGTRGVLGQDGQAAPWLPAFGTPYVATDPGAADPNFIILSGNQDTCDGFYQIINPVLGQTYHLTLNVMRYLPERPGENTRLRVIIADQPQTSADCTGTCHTMGILNEFSDSIWYYYQYSWLAYSTDLKYLTILVENEFEDDGSPASRSYIQIDNVCLDLPNSTVDQGSLTGIQLFPNPTKGDLTLLLPSPAKEDLQVRLFDLWGRSVWSRPLQQGEERFELSLGALPPAVYWIEVQAEDGGVWREKVVRQ
ncbi:MAG: HYR domain-containing protein [Saprospirales bacterium]|nr:HYR domain-containing protein [Saprospirales bacterium]